MPTSRATPVTCSANVRSVSVMSLIVSASAATSPLASTVTFCVRSPLATAVVTCAIWRTWSVRFAAITFTESVRSRHVPAALGTSAWPPSTPSVPTSRATPVTCSANVRSVSVMSLIVSASAATSPLASTVTFCVRSPLATAVVTCAIWRTWSVRLDAITFTDSVRSRHVPETSATCAWPPSSPSVPTSRATRVTSSREGGQPRDHRVDRPLELEHLAARVDRHLLGEVAVGHRGRHLRDLAHLLGEVRGHHVHGVRQVAPRAADALDLGLAAELAVRADLARHARDLVGERAELVDHRVHGLADRG